MTDSNTLDTELDAYSRRAARRGTRKPSTSEIIGYTAAAGGLAFAGGDAMGAVVHFNPATAVGSSVSDNNNFYSFDVDGNGAVLGFSISAGDTSGGSTSYVFASSLGRFNNDMVVGNRSDEFALKLAKGFIVGQTLSNGSFDDGFRLASNNSSGTTYGDFAGTTQYLGFRFRQPNNSGDLRYGWARVRADVGGGSASLAIFEWAYDDSGASIAVGDRGTPVPAPATPLLTLLGLGAMGVQAYRRRRHEGLKRLADEAEGAAA